MSPGDQAEAAAPPRMRAPELLAHAAVLLLRVAAVLVVTAPVAIALLLLFG